MSTPAYQDDELDLTDVEREEAGALAKVQGGSPVTFRGLTEWINRYGRSEHIEGTALLLPTPQYRRIVELNRAAAYPDRPKIRRSR